APRNGRGGPASYIPPIRPIVTFLRAVARPSEAEAALDGGQRIARSVKSRDAFRPGLDYVGMLLEPSNRCRLGVLALVEDIAHHPVFHFQTELELLDELSDIRTFTEIALAHIGID